MGSYTLPSADAIPLARHVGSDFTSGVEIATMIYPGGRRVHVPIGVPLCLGCDGPVTNGFCAECDERWVMKPRRLAPVHTALVGDPRGLTETMHRIAKGA